MSSSTVDVLIVGAGPSGSTAATALANLGHSVAIIDKAIFPRHKTCASWINGLAFSRFPYLQHELDNLVDCPFQNSILRLVDFATWQLQRKKAFRVSVGTEVTVVQEG
jgi:flavin-dependent dehydrogenase